MKWLIVVLAFGLNACSLVDLDKQLTIRPDASLALCIEGSGPPLTGSGRIIQGQLPDGFVGTLRIAPDCSVEIEVK